MRRTKAELAAENAVLIHELEVIRDRLHELLEGEDPNEASDELDDDADDEADDAEDED